MTTPVTEALTVTQADHHAAEAALFELRGYRVKIKPEHWLSQAFARHREQSVRDWLKRAGCV